ncbi:MAG: hypothetical protein IJW83_00810 [Clostridia bacterium]|nr:hypothetical protein [Clostridia bacterium]
MNSPTFEKDEAVLRTEAREADGCRYRYRLLFSQDEQPHGQYTVEVSFESEDGHASTRACALPVVHTEAAVRLFGYLTKHLVTPIDLPYVLEDCITV